MSSKNHKQVLAGGVSRAGAGLALGAVLLAGASPATAQGGSVTTYGCGVNPAGSLKATGGAPNIGQTLELSTTDPTGSTSAGSLALLSMRLSPDPAFPCGTVLPGFGLGGPAGELLLNPAAPAIGSFPPQVYGGLGTSAAFALPIPFDTAVVGAQAYLQGAFLDLGGGIGLTEAVQVNIGDAGDPDLRLRAVSATPNPVQPGETSTITVVIENIGQSPSPETDVEVCDGTGWCATALVPPLGVGETVAIDLPFHANAAHMQQNPHFFTAKVDPADSVEEEDEGNNEKTATKPLFVVNPILVPPAPIFDHDEVFEIEDGKILDYSITEYGAQGSPIKPTLGNPEGKGLPVEGVGSPSPQPKIAPAVAQDDEEALPGKLLEYVVKYEHSVPMPVLPDLDNKFDRFAPENLAQLELRVAMFDGVRRARRQAAAELVQSMSGLGIEVVEYFTLSGSMLVRAPKGSLSFFAQHPKVQHVEAAVEEGTLPPDSIADGRDLIDSDPYFNSGATGVSFTALLDSGIWSSHTLFTGDDNIWFEEDCVNGNSDCDDTGSAAYDADDNCEHGTATASILTGNSDLGSDTRGVTSGWVDSWNVYNSCGLSTTAVHRGFDEAVFWGDKIIVAEMQSNQGPSGSIADDADDAFDAGSCTIAANGNNGPTAGTVNSPANAHKAIGVGAYDVDSLVDQDYVSRGPTSDDRYKPDIQAPTNTQAAGTSFSTDLDPFGGTSGATPYAAGAASVFADWYNVGSLTSANAGKIYAGLINSGDKDWDTPFNNEEGTGAFHLPLNGKLYLGSRTVGDGDSKFVTIDVPAGATEIKAAIWWPENPINSHRDIDLYLLKPDGSTSDSSLSVPSVFEHVRVTAPISAGLRDVEIYGYDVPLFVNQTVYYAISVK
ncbi:MAG: S8 family serine peptidase [Planctomycetota bacterium]